jgi:hypothetical protein
MLRSRLAIVITVVLALPLQSRSQPVNLAEKTRVGDTASFAMELDLKGNLHVVQEGKKESIPIEAKARHSLTQLILSLTDELPETTARLYHEAVASIVVAAEKLDQRLPADRRLIVARRAATGLTCFALAGQLSREELDLVTEHFNPQALPGLLPGKVINVGDNWSIGDRAVQTACVFDGLIKAELKGKLLAVQDGVATFSIEGTAEGIEQGARVKVAVTARGTFDVASSRITTLQWKQTDQREQGPINPASQVEATLTLRRQPTTETAKELSDPALANFAKGPIPARLLELHYTDPKQRYRLVYPRDWHITGQTDTHLILRLLDQGDFIAQATLSVWRKADPGKHSTVAEFKKAVSEAPGWVPGKVLADRELPTGAGRWLYRLTVEGKLEDAAIVQSFFLLAGPRGDQITVTVASKPEKHQLIDNRVVSLVQAIELGGN